MVRGRLLAAGTEQNTHNLHVQPSHHLRRPGDLHPSCQGRLSHSTAHTVESTLSFIAHGTHILTSSLSITARHTHGNLNPVTHSTRHTILTSFLSITARHTHGDLIPVNHSFRHTHGDLHLVNQCHSTERHTLGDLHLSTLSQQRTVHTW